jgi:hypothetical protein
MWNGILWRQYSAAFDMLERAIRACPDDLWCGPAGPPQWNESGVVGFWHLAYHTLFFHDFYLSRSLEPFSPPEPFGLEELDPEGLLPARAYMKPELLAYLAHGREKCRATLAALTDERAEEVCEYPWLRLSFGELLLNNLRHVQHHTAQMNLLLRQSTQAAPRWVATSGSEPG